MKKNTKLFLSGALAFSLCLPSLYFSPADTAPVTVSAATTATGYDSADDVLYVKSGSYIYNWGAREEDCTFLSTYATAFYTGDNTFEKLSQKAGGTSQSTAPTSELYKALQAFMTSKHTHVTGYQETRYQYCYTDCVSNDTEHVSSFYLGASYSSTWDSGKTWNREHVWPNSKCIVSNDQSNDSADIMMLRPANPSENSSRGNKAYGNSTTSSYYNPNENGQDIKGDCARILLYAYTRWGNTSNPWGSSGVIESLSTLLQWMEEDPVDTWEMGRNDAVQAITGTRNVFVDYPEFAFLLFGADVPDDMTTPSGYAKSGTITGGGSGGDSSSDDTTPDEDDTSDGYTSIATLHASAAGTSATAKGVVTAVAKTGFTFNDGTGTMYFYTNKTVPTVNVGDEVEVSGSTSEFGGAKQFSSKDGATYTKKDVDVPAYYTPLPTVWDSDDVEAYTGAVGEYVKFTANIYTSTNSSGTTTYYNAEPLSDSSSKVISLVDPDDDVLGSITLSSTPQTLVVRGYTCYLSNSKYAYVIVTSIVLLENDFVDEAPVVPETPDQGDTEAPDQGDTEVPENPDLDLDSTINGDIIATINCNSSVSLGSLGFIAAAGAVALLLKKRKN